VAADVTRARELRERGLAGRWRWRAR